MRISRKCWLILACILAAYVFNVERWNPRFFFGQFQDDSIYFSTAKALAQGQGYRLVSFPGSPPQTKYPVLYPYLLSWIWRIQPQFPANLQSAIRLNEFFGCWSLIAAFFLARRLDMEEPAALCLTALCAFQPIFLRFSGLLMSDVPFMALFLTTLALADSVARGRAKLPLVLAAGALAGASVELRTLGATLVAGIFCLAIRRRAFREAFLFAGVAGAVTAVIAWPTLLHRTAPIPGVAGVGGLGWNQTVAYYTDYMKFSWRMAIPSRLAFLRLLLFNIRSIGTAPGSIVVGLWNEGRRITAILSVPIWIGIVRKVRRPEGQAVGYVLALYLFVLLAWPYPSPDRFLLPFLPLFFVGLWLELPRFWAMCWASRRRGTPVADRVIAVALVCCFVLLLGFTAWNYLVRDPLAWREASLVQEHVLQEKRQAYEWIRDNTAPDDRIVASEDAVMYLYTGRQGLLPIAFLPQDFYMNDSKALQSDLAHICDAPRQAGARYWLTTNDDFVQEPNKAQIYTRLAAVGAALPVVFRSGENYVQIHDASCLTHQERADCRAAAPILFPDDAGQ